jgi:hypothetical protein
MANFRAKAIFFSIEDLPSEVKESAPTVQASTHSGFPPHKSHVIVFFLSG